MGNLGYGLAKGFGGLFGGLAQGMETGQQMGLVQQQRKLAQMQIDKQTRLDAANSEISNLYPSEGGGERVGAIQGPPVPEEQKNKMRVDALKSIPQIYMKHGLPELADQWNQKRITQADRLATMAEKLSLSKNPALAKQGNVMFIDSLELMSGDLGMGGLTKDKIAQYRKMAESNDPDVQKTYGSAIKETMAAKQMFREGKIDQKTFVKAVQDTLSTHMSFLNSTELKAINEDVDAMIKEQQQGQLGGLESIIVGYDEQGNEIRAMKKDMTTGLRPIQEGEVKETTLGPPGTIQNKFPFPVFVKPGGAEGLSYHIEKEQIGKEQAQDYRVFTDKQGNIVKRELIGKPYANTAGVANIRVQAFGSVPTSTPGIAYDRVNKKWIETDEAGNQRALSSQEVQERNLIYHERMPVSDIKTMQQSVPSVLQLIGQTRDVLGRAEKRLGPLASRWREFWSGKVGLADPDFRKLRTDISLLQTRLMKMHVGARGGEYMMKHFQDLLDAAKDSPENLIAAIDEIETYANEVRQSQINPPTPVEPPSPKSSVRDKAIFELKARGKVVNEETIKKAIELLGGE